MMSDTTHIERDVDKGVVVELKGDDVNPPVGKFEEVRFLSNGWIHCKDRIGADDDADEDLFFPPHRVAEVNVSNK